MKFKTTEVMWKCVNGGQFVRFRDPFGEITGHAYCPKIKKNFCVNGTILKEPLTYSIKKGESK